MVRSLGWYALAALGEIAGCYCFWAWLRLGRGAAWAVAGAASLVAFAVGLTRVEADFAGRAYAAYGGVYIVGTILWLWAVERTRPDRWDVLGAAICLAGTAVILGGPRAR